MVYGRASSGTAYRLRGIAGTVARRNIRETSGGGRLSDLLRDLPGDAAGSPDLWIWQIELENPAP